MLKCAQIVRALDKGWLRGAALDVFQEEPLPPNSLLWNHPQVIGRGFLLTPSKKSVIFTNSFEKQFKFLVTPHVAAMSRPKDIAECFQQNLSRSNQNQYKFFGEDNYPHLLRQDYPDISTEIIIICSDMMLEKK